MVAARPSGTAKETSYPTEVHNMSNTQHQTLKNYSPRSNNGLNSVLFVGYWSWVNQERLEMRSQFFD
jgi:hypothetical protein